MFEILLKKWKSQSVYPFSQCHTAAFPHSTRHLRIQRHFTGCSGFFVVVVYMTFFSVQFLGKDGFLNCSGESCFSGTFNLVYFCMFPRGASICVLRSAQPALFAPAVRIPNQKCCD